MKAVQKITEHLISFDTAKLAKKYHVDLESYDFYTHRGDMCHSEVFENQSKYDGSYGAFTLSLLQKWFREVHDIHVVISAPHYGINKSIVYNYFIYLRSEEETTRKPIYSIDFSSYGAKEIYEESLEAGLQLAFKYIKQ